MDKSDVICVRCHQPFPPHDGKPYVNVCRVCIPAAQPAPERKPWNPLKEGIPEEQRLRKQWLKKGHPLSRINALLHGD